MLQASTRAATRTLLGIVLFSAWVAQASAVTAGVVQFVAGDVQLILATGGQRPASKGSPIDVGDTIATAPRATAQVKMADGAIMVVQPESRLTVVEFRYAGKEDGTEKALYRLERGGFRSITGAIGHTHKGSYLIETPIAHIGIRGTDHETYYLPGQSAVKGEAAKPGLYNKVNVGLTYIRTASGEVTVGPNQVGYAASAQDVPALLPAIPDFFNRSFEPRKVQRGVAPEMAEVPPAQVIQTVSAGTPGRPSEINLTHGQHGTTAPGTGSLVAYTELLGKPFGVTGINATISPNGATLANAGGDVAFGVDWGSWPGNLALVNGKVTTGSVHFIESNQLTTGAQLLALPPGLVTANYSYVGGPPPTDNLGAQGTITGLNVGVNFSTQLVTNYTVGASVGTTNWNASGSGSFSLFTVGTGIPLTGTCTGCAMTKATGMANGAFVGSAAEKMITTFGLQTPTQAISGAAYLSR